MKDLVEEHRGRLFGLAYRMLGDVSEAEDAVQEGFARLVATDEVDNRAAWLTTVVTNVCIDRLRSAQRSRETYVGSWLPEPLITGDADPAGTADTADSLTMAFLTLLERLSPAERAVFLLHDVFGFPHERIAGMLGRSHQAVRKLATRARARLGDDRPRYERDTARRHEVAEAFLDACAGADLDRLMKLLAPDVVFSADGGGVVSAVRHPVTGRERVARFLLGLARQAEDVSWTLTSVEINRQPGLLVEHHGHVDTVLVLHVADGRVGAVHAVRNPGKLGAVRARWEPGRRPLSP